MYPGLPGASDMDQNPSASLGGRRRSQLVCPIERIKKGQRVNKVMKDLDSDWEDLKTKVQQTIDSALKEEMIQTVTVNKDENKELSDSKLPKSAPGINRKHFQNLT